MVVGMAERPCIGLHTPVIVDNSVYNITNKEYYLD